MILTKSSQSLQDRIEKQLYILKKAALVDGVFNETIQLIDAMFKALVDGGIDSIVI